MSNSLLSRKRDLVYFVHFLFALPLMFRKFLSTSSWVVVIDLQVIYDPSLVPAFLKKAKDFYVERYNDQFFINSPPFFKLFVWSEVFVQAPVMLWSLGGLYRIRANNGEDSPNVPLIIFPFALVVFITTLTCMVEFLNWDISWYEKFNLTTLYGPYLILSTLMGVDMFFRLKKMTEIKVQQKKCV
ncbi:hypothetical protein Golomagni_07167 [Golovinomyces magnicellulatus]|nr:hypothetical protein Golomagni_07167 [Golovinomyces magnicellulatus]